MEVNSFLEAANTKFCLWYFNRQVAHLSFIGLVAYDLLRMFVAGSYFRKNLAVQCKPLNIWTEV